MRLYWKAAAIAAAMVSSGAAYAQNAGGQLNGRWDAALVRNGVEIPFRLDIKGDGQTLEGVFFSGWSAYDGTTSASFKDNKLVLNVDHYLTTINAELKNGKLAGNAFAQNRETSAEYTFTAVRHVEQPKTAHAPSIAGSYIIPLDAPSSKGEKAFRFIAQQKDD